MTFMKKMMNKLFHALERWFMFVGNKIYRLFN